MYPVGEFHPGGFFLFLPLDHYQLIVSYCSSSVKVGCLRRYGWQIFHNSFSLNVVDVNMIVPGLHVSRLTDQRSEGAESPAARPGSARRTLSCSRDRPSSSPSPQPEPFPTTAAAGRPSSVSAAGDDTSPVSRSSNQPTSFSAANQRFSAASADAQPLRTGSYHGDFHRKSRFADTPLRAISVDAAGRVSLGKLC